mgnify:CR=1 FL=1
MLDSRHLIKLNKLVILTGLFFIWNSNLLSQGSSMYKKCPDISFPYNQNMLESYEKSIDPGYFQIVANMRNSITVTNYLQDGSTKFYSIRFKERFLRKDKAIIDSSTNFQSIKIIKDSRERIVKVITIQDSVKSTDSTVYDSVDRVIYHSHNEINFKRIIDFDTTKYSNWTRNIFHDYKLLNYKSNSYELIDSDGYIIELNNDNYIIKKKSIKKIKNYTSIIDSIVYDRNRDSLFVNHYTKYDKNSNDYSLQHDQVYLNDKLIRERWYKRNLLGGPSISTNSYLYFYDFNGNLILTKSGKYGQSITLNAYSENSSIINYTVYSSSAINLAVNSYYYSMYTYAPSKDDIRSLEQIISEYNYSVKRNRKNQRYHRRKSKRKSLFN